VGLPIQGYGDRLRLCNRSGTHGTDGTYEWIGRYLLAGANCRLVTVNREREVLTVNRELRTVNGEPLTPRQRRGLADARESVGTGSRELVLKLDLQPFADTGQHEP
jgi:hypothetical protein